MSKEFTIQVNTLKTVVEEVTPFNTKNNCAQFEIGIQPPKENLLVSTVTVVNGGNMLKKEFYVAFEGNEAPTCKFNVSLNTYISYINALLAYQEDIFFEVSDSDVILKAGEHAALSLPLIMEAEPIFQISSMNAYAIFQFNTANYLEFARKGCCLYDAKDNRNVCDRFLFSCDLTSGKMTAYSTNNNAAARAFIECGTNKEGRPNFSTCPAILLYELRRKCETLSGEEKQCLEDKIKAASDLYTNSSGKDPSSILTLSKEENISVSEYSFSLLVSSFQLMKGVLKGTNFFRMIVTDMHCILFTDTNTCAMFTLGSTAPCWPNSVFPSIDKMQPQSEIVVDKQTLLHGLSVFLIATEEEKSGPKEPAHVQIRNNSLTMSIRKTNIAAPCMELTGEHENMSIYIYPKLLQTVLNTLNNGNVYLGFQGSKAPIVVRNGALQEETNSIAIVLPVNMPQDSAENETAEDMTAE